MLKGTRHIPWIFFSIVILFLIVPRFFIFHGLCRRGLEYVSFYRAPGAPFRPDAFSQMEKTCGDLSTLLKRPEDCYPRPEIVQTDRWGYRNTPEVFDRQNEILVFGDSYAFGEGLTQEDTPSEQITRITGKNAYDGGGKMEMNYLRWLLEHFKSPPQTVIYFHLERHHLTSREWKEWDKHISDGPIAEIGPFWETFKQYDPFKILAGKLYFPNTFPIDPPPYTLKDGRNFLFFGQSIQQYDDPRTDDVTKESDFFSEFNQRMKDKNINLLVILIPEKYTVYAPLLTHPPKPVLSGPLYLDKLAQEMNRRSIPTINLLPTFKTRALEEFQRGHYIYWPDDTHWNAEGVKIMAEEIKTFLGGRVAL